MCRSNIARSLVNSEDVPVLLPLFMLHVLYGNRQDDSLSGVVRTIKKDIQIACARSVCRSILHTSVGPTQLPL